MLFIDQTIEVSQGLYIFHVLGIEMQECRRLCPGLGEPGDRIVLIKCEGGHKKKIDDGWKKNHHQHFALLFFLSGILEFVVLTQKKTVPSHND